MTIIVDAGPIISLATLDHAVALRTAALVRTTREPLVIPAPVVAEIDYQLQTKMHPAANRPFLGDLAARRYEVGCLEPADFQTILDVNSRYADLNPGIADLSIIVLAARYRTTRILTFDQRHFRMMQPIQGGTFTLLPFDEPGA